MEMMENNNKNLLNDLKEGDFFLYNHRGISQKWEVIDVLNEQLYVVDDDGFGNLFSYEELNLKGWSLCEKSEILLNFNNE